MERRATAVWQGDLRHGKGTLTTESKALSATPYSFSTRFEGAPGTNPEELLGAAHAGCFTMALTHSLGEAGIKPERIETQATVTLEKQEAGFTITKVHLDVGVQRARRRSREGRDGGAEGEGRLPAQPGAEGRNLDGGTARRLRMLTPFHLAIPVRELAAARAFYGELLGCPEGRSSSRLGRLRFLRPPARLPPRRRRRAASAAAHNPVDGHDVPVPHFGMVLEMPDWDALAARLKRRGVAFVIEPQIRFQGRPGEQATMFLTDPSGNALEFKSFRDIAGQLFAK